MPKRAASASKVLQAGYTTIALSHDRVKEESQSTRGIRQGLRRPSSADALACDSAQGRLRCRSPPEARCGAQLATAHFVRYALAWLRSISEIKPSMNADAPKRASGGERQRTASYASRLRPVNSFGDSIPMAAKSVGAISHSAPCSPLSSRSTPVPLSRANGTSAVV